MRSVIVSTLILLCLIVTAPAQVPLSTGIQILKAEDARRYDAVLEGQMKSPDAAVRSRAALAAGRIGDDRSISALSDLLINDQSPDVQRMAAFALGEIEAISAADAVLNRLRSKPSLALSSQLLEAAGKIAAANASDPRSKDLGKAILDTLRGGQQTLGERDLILQGITALLRARPEGADVVVAEFLKNPDARVRADTANTLTRLKAKNANEPLRKMLTSDNDPVARANSARALGAAEDREAFAPLLTAATGDTDSRVRVSAVRSLGSLKDPRTAEKLLDRSDVLLAAYKKSAFANPVEKNELIEIAIVIGRLLANTRDPRAVSFLREFSGLDNGRTPEIPIARLRVAPGRGNDAKKELTDWHQYSTLAQAIGEFAAIEPTTDEARTMKKEAPGVLRLMIDAYLKDDQDIAADPEHKVFAAPDYLRSYAQFKTSDLAEVLRNNLVHSDVFVRAAAAELLAEQPGSKENVEALKKAFTLALLKDKDYDDAQLAILDALYKQDKKEAVGTLLIALASPDYLVRKKALGMLADTELQKDFPGLPTSIENARVKHKDQVLPYSLAFGTRLGQLLNTDADYRRALLRKNGAVKAILSTDKGNFTIDLFPEDAPLTVDNFIKLARTKYFNGVEVHRVVPNFVMQDGDPRGDGNGGPGWSIRCEINMLPYDRGAVGMALSGKDTGGSQWFVTHSPQPHLDGGYTVFGHVNETDMKVVDNIVRGDKIISVKILEALPQRIRGKTKNRK